LNIYIPSINRAGKVTSHLIFPEKYVFIVVPYSQYADYKKHYKNVICIHDSEDFIISRKRNAVLDLIDKTKEKVGIIIDDDVKGIKKVTDTTLVYDKIECYSILKKLMYKAVGLKAGLFGLHRTTNLPYVEKNRYGIYSPVYVLTGINFRNAKKVYYDTALTKYEDMDYYLQQIKINRLTITDTLYALVLHEVGCNTNIKDKIQESEDYLLKKWPGQVIRYKTEMSKN